MKTESVINHIAAWLRDYNRRAGAAGFVVGVSGGIDSAVTSTLCARTKEPVWVLNMPIFQHPGQVDLADRHLSWLKQHYPQVAPRTVDLSEAFSAFQQSLPGDITDDLAMANARSRLRMMTLYAFASHYGLLVAGTGNKVEDFGVGFYTKYGDGGVDLSPIADLLKTQVYALAEALEVLPEIRQAPPTDGLWGDNRTDEVQLGATYGELEWAMAHEAGPRDDSSLDDRQRQVLDIFRRLNRANQHKMVPIPVCHIPADMLSD